MTDNLENDRYLSAAHLCERYGGVSRMWIERRLQDDATFPKPIYIANRRFWRMSQVVAWEKSKVTR